MAVVEALQYAASLGVDEVTCYLDSELVVKQLRGEFAVRSVGLLELWKRAWELRSRFRKAVFVSVPRTDRYIREADSLVNEALDEEFRKNRVKT